MNFSERFKEIREDRGFTQQELAEALHLTPATVSHYEKGNREPSLDVLVQIAEFLDVSVEYLLGFSNFNITHEQIKKTFVKGISTGIIVERILKLDTSHRQTLINILKCIEAEQYISKKINL